MTDGLTEMLNRRRTVADRVIKALSHLSHEHAMFIVMAWISIDRLEELANFVDRKEGEGVDG